MEQKYLRFRDLIQDDNQINEALVPLQKELISVEALDLYIF